MSIVFARRAVKVAALLALAGCSGAATSVAPSANSAKSAHQYIRNAELLPLFIRQGVRSLPTHPAHVFPQSVGPDYSTKHPLLYEADQQQGAINIYQISKLGTNPPPIATITGVDTPYGLARNKAGILFAAAVNTNQVLLFKKGKKKSYAAITDGISGPQGLTIDPSGTLFVSNGTAGTVTEYPKGATSPSQTITGFTCPFGSSSDANGNVFVADFCNLQVYEIASGAANATPLNLTDLEQPIGTGIDKAGNLWVSDGGGSKVNVYAPGSTTPMQEITGLFNFPYQISVDQKGQVFVGDAGLLKIFGFKPGQYTPYVTVTNGITLPTGTLARP